jgi:CHAD domain-containing protein
MLNTAATIIQRWFMRMQAIYELQGSISINEICGQLSGEKTWHPEETTRQRVKLKDDFSRHLWRAGYVLFESSDNQDLTLWCCDGRSISVPNAAGARFWWELEPGELRDVLRRHLDVCAFTTWGEVVFTTEQGAILNRDEKTVLRLEFRTVEHDEQPSVSMVALWALRGYEKHFAEMCRVLRKHGYLEHKTFSLHHMLKQAGIPVSMPLSPTPFNLDPQEPVSTALCDMAKHLLDVARQYESGIIADTDTEFVHQYRVNMRKLRSLLKQGKKVFDPRHGKILRIELKQMASSTGALRDLDVFILDTYTFKDLLPEELRPGLEQVRSRLKRKRNRALTRVCRNLESEAYAEQIKNCEELLDMAKNSDSAPNGADIPVLAFAATKIVRQYRRLCADTRKISHKSTDEELHSVRIQVKQLRYLLDLFQELLPAKEACFLIRRLKKLQDRLGGFNDVVVQRRFINDLLQHDKLSEPERDTLNGLSAIMFQKYLKERECLGQDMSDFCTGKIRKNLKKISGLIPKQQKGA